jgi:hypothetical protein
MSLPGFNPAVLLPLAAQIGDYVRQAVGRYGDLRAAGMHVDADVLAAFIEERAAGWNPTIGGIAVLDAPTKAAGCRFLAGIAYKLAGGL